MRVLSLAHVCIKTTDLDQTSNFYCGTLGMTRLFDFTRKGDVIGFYLKAGNATFIEVFLADQVEKIDRQILSHLCLQCDSLESVRKNLIERGHAPGEIKLGADHSHQFWMQDPQGMAIEFQEYTDLSSQLTGKDVEVDW